MMPLLALALAFVIGGIPFGFLFVKWKTGRDIRGMGSGNIGATNVLRTSGLAVAAATLVLDIGKGYFAVWLTDRLTGGSTGWMSAAAVAVMLGHAYPVLLKFRGGKAVASFMGAYLYLTPVPLLASAFVFLIMVAGTRFISLGSVVAAGLFPLAVWLVLHPPKVVLASALFSAIFIVYRHRTNLQRLRAASEHILRLKHDTARSAYMVRTNVKK